MGHGSKHNVFRLKYQNWRNAAHAFLSEREGEWWSGRDLLDVVLTLKGRVYRAQNKPKPNNVGQILVRDGRFETKWGYHHPLTDGHKPYSAMLFSIGGDENDS